MVTEPLSTSEQIANGIRQTAFQPNEAYASYTEARDDAQIQAALYRLQGNPEAAAKVEAQWETNFALNFAGGGSGALRKLPRSGADVWEAGPIAKGKLEADAPNLDTKPGPGGTSLAGLPEHYREGGSVGAAFNEAGGLPDGYRRVLNTKTGNTEVVSSDGVFYFETANGLRPKAGGNLAGQVEAERRIAGAKGTAQVVPDVISPTYRELQGLNKGFQAHHTLPQYLGKMLGYTKNDMLDHPATLITQYSHTGKVNPDAMHKAISKYLPPMVGGKPATYTPGQISSGLQKAYGDIGRPELFDSIKHLIK